MFRILLILGLILGSFTAAAQELYRAAAIEYHVYSKPKNVSPTAAKLFMVEKNGFVIDSGYLRSGNTIHDFVLDVGKRFEFLENPPMLAGVANVRNAQEINELFFTVSESSVRFSPAKTNSRDCLLDFNKCDGRIVGIFPQNHLVYAKIEYNGFMLVTDGEYVAWIEAKRLRPFDYNKIYLKNASSDFKTEMMQVECEYRRSCAFDGFELKP